ncbi:MAG: hypothetical protein EOP06_09065 [Proteobacteria bacterium]|nr:MAG: hypothetical protein EOP06_09065 [Pseudomonadota bacterium]
MKKDLPFDGPETITLRPRLSMVMLDLVLTIAFGLGVGLLAYLSLRYGPFKYNYHKLYASIPLKASFAIPVAASLYRVMILCRPLTTYIEMTKTTLTVMELFRKSPMDMKDILDKELAWLGPITTLKLKTKDMSHPTFKLSYLNRFEAEQALEFLNTYAVNSTSELAMKVRTGEI